MGNRHTEFLALDHIAQVRAEANRGAHAVRKVGRSPGATVERRWSGLERLRALVLRRPVPTATPVAISSIPGKG